MAESAAKKINFTKGLVIVPSHVKPKLKKSIFKIISAGHPLPNPSSLMAGKNLISFFNYFKKFFKLDLKIPTVSNEAIITLITSPITKGYTA